MIWQLFKVPSLIPSDSLSTFRHVRMDHFSIHTRYWRDRRYQFVILFLSDGHFFDILRACRLPLLPFRCVRVVLLLFTLDSNTVFNPIAIVLYPAAMHPEPFSRSFPSFEPQRFSGLYEVFEYGLLGHLILSWCFDPRVCYPRRRLYFSDPLPLLFGMFILPFADSSPMLKFTLRVFYPLKLAVPPHPLHL